MRIGELIVELQKLRERHGDVRVVIQISEEDDERDVDAAPGGDLSVDDVVRCASASVSLIAMSGYPDAAIGERVVVLMIRSSQPGVAS